MQKFVSKLGSILGETVSLGGKQKPEISSQHSYSNLSTVDQNKTNKSVSVSQFEAYGNRNASNPIKKV